MIVSEQRNSSLFIASLIVLHLLIVLPLAYYLNIWADEASTLYTTQNGFFQAFHNVFADEKQAPLYFLALSVWRNLNDSIFFARLLSISFSLLSIKVFFDVAARFFKDNEAKLLTVFFALHPYLIWASLEIRLYSAVVLLCCLLLLFFYDGYLDVKNESRYKAQVLFVLTSVIALYTNYYLGFLLVGFFVALLTLRRFRIAKSYFLQMFLVGAAILPLLRIIHLQMSLNSNRAHTDPSIIEGIKLLWNHFLTFILPTELFPSGDVSLLSIIRIWLVRLGILATILVLAKNKFRAIDEKVLFFGSVSLITCGFYIFAYFVLDAEYISLRHAAPLFPLLILFVASVLVNILPKKGWIIFAALILPLFIYSGFNLYPGLAKRGDWVRIGEYIKSNERPNQPIIVFTAYDAITLPYQYTGVNKIYPDERFFEWDPESGEASEDTYRRQIEFIISKIPTDAKEIWLVTREDCQNSEQKVVCLPLENFIEANYTVEKEVNFYLETVRLLRKNKND